MKALFFTDLHVHNYKQFDTDSSRLNNCLRVIDLMFQYAYKHDIETILFGGDLYDRQKAIPVAVVNGVVAKFTHLFNTYKDIKFVAISGNHDQASANLLHAPAETSLRHLNTIFENFRLIDDYHYTLDIGLQVHGIPYYEYADDYHKQLDKVIDLVQAGKASDTYTRHILLIHQTPDGIMNAGIPMDTNPNDKRYCEFEFIGCGHIHNKQILTPTFILGGSPIHRDANDIGQDKGFWILDFNGGTKEEPKTTYIFKSLNKIFPTFKVVESYEEGEVLETNSFIIVKPQKRDLIALPTLTDNFTTDLTQEALVKNFWQEKDGQNEELLAMGLKFLS